MCLLRYLKYWITTGRKISVDTHTTCNSLLFIRAQIIASRNSAAVSHIFLYFFTIRWTILTPIFDNWGWGEICKYWIVFLEPVSSKLPSLSTRDYLQTRIAVNSLYGAGICSRKGKNTVWQSKEESFSSEALVLIIIPIRSRPPCAHLLTALLRKQTILNWLLLNTYP